MPAYLVALNGQADIPIDRVLIVVGRHRLCDVRITSAQVSRRHCCLALDRDGVLVRDLGSTNGTRINGRRVDVGILRPGDELSIAEARFRLVAAGKLDPGGQNPITADHPTEPDSALPVKSQEPDPTQLADRSGLSWRDEPAR